MIPIRIVSVLKSLLLYIPMFFQYAPCIMDLLYSNRNTMINPKKKTDINANIDENAYIYVRIFIHNYVFQCHCNLCHNPIKTDIFFFLYPLIAVQTLCRIVQRLQLLLIEITAVFFIVLIYLTVTRREVVLPSNENLILPLPFVTPVTVPRPTLIFVVEGTHVT